MYGSKNKIQEEEMIKYIKLNEKNKKTFFLKKIIYMILSYNFIS